MNVLRYSFISLLLLAVFFIRESHAAIPDPFEGKIIIEMKVDYELTPICYFIKGDKIKIESRNRNNELQYSTIIDMTENKAINIKHFKKNYSVYNLDSVKIKTPEAQIIRTGERKFFIKYMCEKVIISSGFMRVEAWIAEEMKDLYKNIFPFTGGSRTFNLQQEFEKIGFPFSFYGIDHTFDTEMYFEVISLNPAAIDESEFLIPAEYIKE